MKKRRPRGFSLLEILVAFSILALSLGILMQIFSTSVQNAGISNDRAQAVVLAQSLLAAAGVEAPLVEGGTSGVVADKFHWRVDAAPIQLGQSDTGSYAQSTPASLQLWEVSANVEWGQTTGHRGRELTIHTMRALPSPGP